MAEKNVLVLGGGIAGLTAALDLAKGGSQVSLVEKEKELGGHAAKYCCKATASTCQKCGACFVGQQINAVVNHPAIQVFSGLNLEDVKRNVNNYVLHFAGDNNEKQKLQAEAVILATGFRPYDASKKTEYGYDEYPEVITAMELEDKLREKGSIKKAFQKQLNKVAFIQCVGSRCDASEENYCCRVGCMYAVRLANLLRDELPEAQIDIYYMDLQNFGKGFTDYRRQTVEDNKINFILGRPAKVYNHPRQGLLMKHECPSTGELKEENYDMVFLSTGSQPGKSTPSLAEKFNVLVNEDNFFETELLSPGSTQAPGVFVAGTCSGPRDIADSMQQAKAVAREVEMYLGNNEKQAG